MHRADYIRRNLRPRADERKMVLNVENMTHVRPPQPATESKFQFAQAVGPPTRATLESGIRAAQVSRQATFARIHRPRRRLPAQVSCQLFIA